MDPQSKASERYGSMELVLPHSRTIERYGSIELVIRSGFGRRQEGICHELNKTFKERKILSNYNKINNIIV